MKKRILGGFLVAVVFGSALWLGKYALAPLLCLMSIFALIELFRAFREKQIKLFLVPAIVGCVLWYAGMLFVSFLTAQNGTSAISLSSLGLWLIVLLMLFTGISSVLLYPKRSVGEAGLTVFAFVYAVLLLSLIYPVRERGLVSSLYIFAASWGSDIFAYFAGSLFGKRKAFPELSPHKTYAGIIGGIVGAMVLCAVVGWLGAEEMGMSVAPAVLISLGIGLVGSVLAQAGDLFASAVKRYTGIKDYGKLIPGHGGILDRFDSVIFVAPVVELLLTMGEGLGG